MKYSESIDFIMSQLPMYQRMGAAAYKADLNTTIDLLKHLNNPERKFKCVHIAGTNGKGSVSHMLASIFRNAGYKTGLYTSPHLCDFRERIQIDGNLIPKNFVNKFIDENNEFLRKIKPSFFEMSVGLAFDFFAKNEIDIAIVETGMGGRLDSTNVVTPELSVITNISFDHTAFLGDTISKISKEKAGIIKPEIPVVIGETQADADIVFNETAKKTNSEICFADKYCSINILEHQYLPPIMKVEVFNDDFSYVLPCPLAGIYQLKNLKTVITAVELLKRKGYNLSHKSVVNGVKYLQETFQLRGRWQHFLCGRNFILDTGHNQGGLEQVSEMLNSLKNRNLHIVLGMVNDKKHADLISLLPKHATYYFCKPSVPRGFDEKDLAQIANGIGRKGKHYLSVKSAIKAAVKKTSTDDLIYIGGSTFTVADGLAYLDKYYDSIVSKYCETQKNNNSLKQLLKTVSQKKQII